LDGPIVDPKHAVNAVDGTDESQPLGAEDGSRLTRRTGSKRVIGVKGVGSP